MSGRKLFAIVGCSKMKATPEPFDPWIPARELYISDLFKKRVAHVESRSIPWFVVSAKSGLVTPGTPLRPYDETLSEKDPIDVAAWHLSVASRLIDELYYSWEIKDFKSIEVEIHAGSRYSQPLDKILEMFGAKVTKPVAGMGIGEQLAYYSGNVSTQK